MGLADIARKAVRLWWIMLLGLILGAGSAVLLTSQLAPVYQSTLTFYVVAPASERLTPLQADELVRGRIDAYPGLMTSDQFIGMIIDSADLDLSNDQARSRIIAVGDSETRTLSVEVRDDDPERSLAIATEIADNFGQMVQDIERAPGSTAGGTSLTAISGPSLAQDPVSPRPTLNLAVGALLGLGLGIAVVITLIRMDRTIRTVDQLASDDIYPLAVIPLDPEAARLAPSSADYLNTRIAEGVRGLRTSIQFHLHEGPVQLIAVTSVSASEGRTTTALNLAFMFSEAQKKVLLVEADLRTPRLADRLGLAGGRGLVDVLRGEVAVSDAVQHVGALDVIVAGSHAARPSEVLASPQFRETLAALRSSYDLIVLDSPPIRPFTDAALVCQAADGTVVVVRYGRTTSDELANGLRTLAAVRCQVLGTVLNMVPGRSRMSLHDSAPVTSERRAARTRSADLRSSEVITPRTDERRGSRMP